MKPGDGMLLQLNGNDPACYSQSFKKCTSQKLKNQLLIIGKTIMGKGAVTESGESYESKCETHGMPLTNAGASFAKSIENLGGDPENPFRNF